MRRMHALPAAAVTALALFVAGCGGSNDNNSSQPASSTPKQTSTPASSGSGSSSGGTSGKGVTVDMKNIQFAPKTITVKPGTTITWTNDDSVAHNVVAQSGASFKSDDFGQGGSYSTKVTKPGTIKYVCTIHPGMDGEIVVK
jgi:plastocyanin